MTRDPTSTQAVPGPDTITDARLPNGMRALVRENHNSPAVVVDGVLFGGALHEDQAQRGLAALTARMLDRGTDLRSFEELSDALESVGAEVGFDSGQHTSSFDAKCLAEDLHDVLALTAEVISRPSFPGLQLERVRGQTLTVLQQRLSDTRFRAAMGFRELAYGAGHPYARGVHGTPESITAIGRDDLVSFYESVYHPAGGVVVVVGAVDAPAAIQMLSDTIGSWQPAGDPPSQGEVDAPPASTERRDVFVPLPGKVQADVVLGNPAIPRAHPDWLAAALANTVLGVFGLMGRLGKAVRDAKGLAYYAVSNLSGGLGPGPWLASAGVNPGNVDEAVNAILVEMQRMCEEAVPEEELADVKSYVTGSLPLRLETNEGVAGAILEMVLYDLGLDYLQHFDQEVMALGPADVMAAAQAHLRPDAPSVAVAGPPAG